MKTCYIVVGILVFTLGAGSAFGTLYPFTIFTNNGNFNDDPGMDLYMDVSNGDNIVKFTFYNDSTVQSSITRIYFDDGPIIGSEMVIINGSGTLFAEDGPTNLPSGNTYDPPFIADREFNIGADPAPPDNGINNIGAGEWATIELTLDGFTLQDVLDGLNDTSLRVGIHIQSFSDGSSESAINEIPEPTTICLFGLGGLALLRKRKK